MGYPTRQGFQLAKLRQKDPCVPQHHAAAHPQHGGTCAGGNAAGFTLGILSSSMVDDKVSIGYDHEDKGSLMHWPQQQRYRKSRDWKKTFSIQGTNAHNQQLQIDGSGALGLDHLGQGGAKRTGANNTWQAEPWSGGAEFGWTSQIPSHRHQKMMCHDGLIFFDVYRISPYIQVVSP